MRVRVVEPRTHSPGEPPPHWLELDGPRGYPRARLGPFKNYEDAAASMRELRLVLREYGIDLV